MSRILVFTCVSFSASGFNEIKGVNSLVVMFTVSCFVFTKRNKFSISSYKKDVWYMQAFPKFVLQTNEGVARRDSQK